MGLLGLRLGATLAATAAESRPDVDRLVLWAPIVDGARYAQDLLRINITTQLAVYREVREDRAALVEAMRAGQTANVDGYEVGIAMYEGLTGAVAQGRRGRLRSSGADRPARSRRPGAACRPS